jgi:hypothetical protein
MASAFLSRTAPTELVLSILDACESARDALALSSACRMLFHVGRRYAVARLWSELQNEIPYFEEALIAVGTESPQPFDAALLIRWLL